MPDSSIPLPIGGETIYAGWGNTVRLAVHDLAAGHDHDGVLSKKVDFDNLSGTPNLVNRIVKDGTVTTGTITFVEGPNVTIDVNGQSLTFSAATLSGEFVGTVSPTQGRYLVQWNSNNTTVNVWDGMEGTIIHSGTLPSVEIQWALDNLTTDRKWKEEVYLSGSIEIDNTITVGSFTVLRINGILKFKDNIGDYKNIIQNKNLAVADVYDDYIEICGGIIDANVAGGNTNNWVMRLYDVNHWEVHDLTVLGSRGIKIGRFSSNKGTWGRFYNNKYQYVAPSEDDSPFIIWDQEYFEIFNNHIIGDGTIGGLDIRNSKYGLVSNNVVESGWDFGILVGESTLVTVNGNAATGCGNSGIEVAGITAGSGPHFISVVNNICESNLYGIWFTFHVKECLITGNICRNNDGGIGFSSSTLMGTMFVEGNYLDNIDEDIYLGTVATVFISNNYFGTTATNKIQFAGNQFYTVRNNFGFITENNGISTLASGEIIDTELTSIPVSVHLTNRGTTPVVFSWNTIDSSSSIVIYHTSENSIPVSWEAKWRGY